MDQLAVSQKRDCLICSNGENNTNLTSVNSEKILTSCRIYLDNSVTIQFSEKDTPVSCCNYCYESAVELLLLEKQIKRLENDISELSSSFLKSVVQRRNQFNKEKNHTFSESAPPGDKCVTVNNSLDNSTVAFENFFVQKEIVESGSTGLPPNCQETTEIEHPVNDFGFVAGDEENINHSQEEVEVKFSGDRTFSEVVPDDEQIEPNQEMSGTIAHDCLPPIKTSMADLINCLKQPIIQLERFQSGKRRKSNIVADKTSSDSNLETTDPENSSTSSMDNDYLPNGNIILTDSTVLPKIQENVMSIYSSPLNASVNPGEETAVKCENDEDENKPCKCSICGHGFFKLRDLEDHQKLHNIVDHYSCNVCDKSFLDPKRLKLHERFHTARRPFNSSSNSKSGKTSASNLNAHKKIHSDTPFKCSICSKSFKTITRLKRHQIFHSSENRRFKCSFCCKSFFFANDARKHEMIHTGERPFKCQYCPKSFIVSRDLKNHEATHTGETFKCSICFKSFKSVHILKMHKLIHSKERPYKCSFCSKSFISSRELKSHEKVHDGDTQNKCSFCSKSFGSVYHLKRHKMVHTGERPYKCSSCEMSFKLKHHLKKHCSRMHENNKEEFILP